MAIGRDGLAVIVAMGSKVGGLVSEVRITQNIDNRNRHRPAFELWKDIVVDVRTAQEKTPVLQGAASECDVALATVGHPHGDPGHRRGRSRAVIARSEPRALASGRQSYNVVAGTPFCHPTATLIR